MLCRPATVKQTILSRAYRKQFACLSVYSYNRVRRCDPIDRIGNHDPMQSGLSHIQQDSTIKMPCTFNILSNSFTDICLSIYERVATIFSMVA